MNSDTDSDLQSLPPMSPAPSTSEDHSEYPADMDDAQSASLRMSPEVPFDNGRAEYDNVDQFELDQDRGEVL